MPTCPPLPCPPCLCPPADSIHAGGLRYHGMSPLISHVKDLGLVSEGQHTVVGLYYGGTILLDYTMSTAFLW